MTTWAGCMFSYELDVLEIRLATLDSVVDRHVIVESPVTHTGEPKPLVFAENRDRFKPWSDKIIHLVDERPPTGTRRPAFHVRFSESDSDDWRRERHQRETLSLAFADADPDDLILISDCDEIPDPDRCWDEAARLAGLGWIAQPRLAMHVGRLRWRWPAAPLGTRTRFLTGKTLRSFSYDGSVDHVVRARAITFGPCDAAGLGWHLSFLGTVDDISRKLNSFAHQELNRAPFNSPAWIEHCLATGVDLFGRADKQAIECALDQIPSHVRASKDLLTRLW